MDGGLFLVPSGPGLAELGRNPYYVRALNEADIILIDSGYLALLRLNDCGRHPHPDFSTLRDYRDAHLLHALFDQEARRPSVGRFPYVSSPTRPGFLQRTSQKVHPAGEDLALLTDDIGSGRVLLECADIIKALQQLETLIGDDR